MNINILNSVLDPIIFDPKVRNYNNDDPLALRIDYIFEQWLNPSK